MSTLRQSDSEIAMGYSDCYWQALGLCCFDPEEPAQCKSDKPCIRYVRQDKIDDYIRHLLEELDYYYKLP